MDPILKAFNDYMAAIENHKKAHERQSLAYKETSDAKIATEQAEKESRAAERQLMELMEIGRPYRTPDGYRFTKGCGSVEIELPEVVLAAD